VLGLGLRPLRLAARTRTWPLAEGVIRTSEVIASRDAEGGWMYLPQISYTYRVDDRPFAGTRIRWDDEGAMMWSFFANRLVDRHAAGSACHVAYDPENPASAVLVPGIASSHWILPVVGVALMVIGISWLV
jgi:hypothetical protein